MKTSIKEEKQNPFLKRKELFIEIDHSSAPTPSKASLQQLLSKELREEVEKIDIRSVYSGHGLAKAEAKIFVWHEKKIKDLSKKESPKEEEKKEEKPKEEKTEEKKEGPAKEKQG
jgi:ribosomal protein S24E